MTVETAEQSLQQKPEANAQESRMTSRAISGDGRPIWVEPDLDFIQALSLRCGESVKKCFQCGTCSATCPLSPDQHPFPRKEMAWATWGMKDLLLKDPGVWLCHQCNDCSTRCPRGARPGDVLAAIRQESILHYAAPRFLGRWLSRPHYIPLLLGIPAALLTAALLAKDPVEKALGISPQAGRPILYAYSSLLPHWLLNAFFGFFTLLVVIAVLAGALRFWRAMKTVAGRESNAAGTRSLIASVFSALKKILVHDNFAQCTAVRSRFASHLCVFFGFLALTLVTLWVITARYNPLVQGDFVYPFGFWNPWKMLANAGGAALIIGCFLMIRERVTENNPLGVGTYFDWALLAMLLLVVLTGFITEVLHLLRLEPHRHIAYFVHLVFVFVLLMYLPYSKLAHLVYRGAAMVFAEHSGWNKGSRPVRAASE